MRSLGGELAQHVFIRELAAAECGVRQVVVAGGLMTLTSAGAPPTSCMITGWSLITDHRPLVGKESWSISQYFSIRGAVAQTAVFQYFRHAKQATVLARSSSGPVASCGAACIQILLGQPID